MKKSRLPTPEECLDLLNQYRVPDNIIRHSLAVAKVAVFLAEQLVRKGLKIDLDVLAVAALLHDIARICDFKQSDYEGFEKNASAEYGKKWRRLRAEYKDLFHEDTAYDILKDRFPSVALAIKRHCYMAMLDEKSRPESWEQKLLFYADMRVMHDKVVPLKKRLADGHKRNVHFHGSAEQSKINTAKVDPLIYHLEKEIFEKLDLEPDELTEKLIDTYSNDIKTGQSRSFD